MSDTQPLSAPPAPVPAALGSQPGGNGLFVQLELAWGSVRRALLQALFPNYCRASAARLRGDPRSLSHAVVDARDLKFDRPGAECWFDRGDDPWTGRSCLGFTHYGVAELVGFSVVMAALAVGVAALAAWVSLWWALLGVPVAVVWALIVWFFRDPERRVPADADALVSPADGVVTHVEEVDEPDFPGGRALRVSIFLSIFDVHVNRTPRAARVEGRRYLPGAYLDARNPECATRNEQLWLDLREPNGRPLRVKQVAGAVARRIVCWPRDGEDLAAGERYGMIKFGSRTDVLVPAADVAGVLAKVGQKVRGGETVLARLRGEA